MIARRKLNSGPNFDLITMIDLTDRLHRTDTMNQIDAHLVLVGVMAPVCGPFGPPGQLNERIHPESCQRSYAEAAHIAKFCGDVALKQLSNHRHSIQEQPHPSKLYESSPWPLAFSKQGLAQQLDDRCTCGLNATRGQHKRFYI